MNVLDIIAGPLVELLKRVIPDPQARAAAQLELLKLQQAGEFRQLEADLQLALAQAATNKAEAESPSLFKGGWRPFIGWVCGVGIAYQFLARPLLAWASAALWQVPVPPPLDMGELMTIVMGMLGLAGMRSFERKAGVIPAGK